VSSLARPPYVIERITEISRPQTRDPVAALIRTPSNPLENAIQTKYFSHFILILDSMLNGISG